MPNREERRAAARQPDPTIEELPAELQAALAQAGPPPAASVQTIDLNAWRFGVAVEGEDEHGQPVRAIECVTADGALIVRLHGINAENAQIMAAAITAPVEKPSDLLLPPERRIVLPGQ